MRIALACLAALAASLALYAFTDFAALSQWVVTQQRGFQNQMAGAAQALRAGDLGAYGALLAATGAYGFVHALGPGHGKYLVGGVGLGSGVSARKLVAISAASSLAQAAWAILLVYGGFAVLEVSARQVTELAEAVLAPASYALISAVGLFLVWRGGRSLLRRRAALAHAPVGHHHDHHHHRDHHHDHHHDAACGCGHAHGPTPDQVAGIGSLREALALIASIAVRPCTGAIFLLVIAWQMEIRFAGAAAVMVMGLGTAALTSLVALSSVAARRLALASADQQGVASLVFPVAQVFAGSLVFWISLGLLVVAI
jgi:ABC-type nickel/cobalt efflux system permease component RcnA